MLIPIRCFSCNKVIGNKWENYQKFVFEKGEENIDNILTELGLIRYCCRRMILSHANLIDKILLYDNSKLPIE